MAPMAPAAPAEANSADTERKHPLDLWDRAPDGRVDKLVNHVISRTRSKASNETKHKRALAPKICCFATFFCLHCFLLIRSGFSVRNCHCLGKYPTLISVFYFRCASAWTDISALWRNQQKKKSSHLGSHITLQYCLVCWWHFCLTQGPCRKKNTKGGGGVGEGMARVNVVLFVFILVCTVFHRL